MVDVCIIGSGPAGMGTALYSKRAGLETLILEGTGVSGGQILQTYEVDNYLGMPGINGFDMGMAFRQHIDGLEVPVKDGTVDSIEKTPEGFLVHLQQETIAAKTVIVATGASHNLLQVPGEEELTGMGVSYCATCDGAFFRGKKVVVAGGGDVALEDAIFLARFCEKVTLVHRRDALRGAKILQDTLLSLPNVDVLWNTKITEIKGSDQVEAVSIENVLTKEQQDMPVDGVFIAVGTHPNTEFMGELVEKDSSGYLVAGEDCATSVPGIFAVGDVRTKALRQVITAVADGANAVTSIQSYLLHH